MNISMFKIFQIFGIVSTWAMTALADGKITIQEAVDLAVSIAGILGVAMEVEVPLPGPEKEEGVKKPVYITDEVEPDTQTTIQKPVED
ncbi:MAG: hypothetical protein IMF10_04285 [Proteobacteria bacterium]|nr:hypothetical protein [Pseudomonadota bacterium]